MQNNRYVTALLMLGSCGLLTNCGGSESGTQSQSISEPQDSSYSFTVDVSPFEEAILADGDVTRAELDQAHAAAVACMADKGVKDSGISYRPPWTIGFETASIVEGALTGDDVGNITEQCEQEFFDAARDLFFIKHHATPAEEEDFRIKITACLKENGVVVDPSVVTLRQLLEKYQVGDTLQVFSYCRTAAEIELTQ